MNSYFKSTQFKNWIKTEEEISKIEKSKPEKVFKRINEVNAIIKKENEEKSLSNNLNLNKNPQNNTNNNKEGFETYKNPTKCISLDKEKILIIVYAKRLIKILQKTKSSSLKNISITYFRRFFLKKSILDYDPIYIMAASVLLGSKVAQINLHIEDIQKFFPIRKIIGKSV